MRPKRIFLVRHGESEGNVDKEIYKVKPDYALLLTELGKRQAQETGIKLKKLIGEEKIAAYWSPFYRSRQTTDIILRQLAPEQYSKKFMREESTLREQEWSGAIREDGTMSEVKLERDIHGHFLYRFSRGESCADLHTRLSDFNHTLHRDFKKDNFPSNCLISSHGMTLRVFCMRWFHTSFEEFELWANPRNGEIFEMQLNSETRKYELITPFRKYEEPRSIFPYPFGPVGGICE